MIKRVNWLSKVAEKGQKVKKPYIGKL